MGPFFLLKQKESLWYFSENHFLGSLDLIKFRIPKAFCCRRQFPKAFCCRRQFGAHKSKSILKTIFLGPPFPTAEQVHPRVPELLINLGVY